jgi:hypothetical protein
LLPLTFGYTFTYRQKQNLIACKEQGKSFLLQATFLLYKQIETGKAIACFTSTQVVFCIAFGYKGEGYNRLAQSVDITSRFELEIE